jgi:RNA polymerase sigma-70 factor (ECF subfamily)
LNFEEQDLIRLRYVAELTFAEIADLLGRREEAVKRSLYRLLARLKGQME